MVHSLLTLQGARNEIFAMQPAPIQVSYMGFPGTMGATYINYLITDEVRKWNAHLSVSFWINIFLFLFIYLFLVCSLYLLVICPTFIQRS